MKRIISIVILLTILISTCACGTTSEPISFDEKIINQSEAALQEWGVEEGQTFSVKTNKSGVYYLDINGEELIIKIEETKKDVREKNNIEECNSDILEIVKTSKEKIVNYINQSKILKNKDRLIIFIENIPVKMADFSDEEGAAQYDLEQKTIFINKKLSYLVCEWMILHEFVHALCDETNSGNLRYPYATFNEVMTDIITASMNPRLPRDYQSGYTQYYQWIYLYLGCVGSSGLEAYFYGYDNLSISMDELDVYVESIEVIDSAENAIVVACNCINKWGLEKAG